MKNKENINFSSDSLDDLDNSKKAPERTCVICKSKHSKENLLRLVLKVKKENEYIFDRNQKKQSRGTYVCKSLTCLSKLQKHNKINIEPEDLIQMLNLIKKEEKDYLNILSSMKNSGKLVFGMNLLFENIQKVNFIIFASDISKKNYEKIRRKAIELEIPYIDIETKEELGKIFNKNEVNVIGITNKKMAKGLIVR